MSNALSEELLLCLCICVDVHLSVNDELRDLCKGNNFYGKPTENGRTYPTSLCLALQSSYPSPRQAGVAATASNDDGVRDGFLKRVSASGAASQTKGTAAAAVLHALCKRPVLRGQRHWLVCTRTFRVLVLKAVSVIEA